MDDKEYRVEKHIIGKNNPLWNKCDNLCFFSKNLYNATLYAVRQHYFTTKEYLCYEDVYDRFVKERNLDYCAMNSKVAQATMKLVDQNFKSFFALLKKPECKDNARIPKYLHKTNGRQVAHFSNQAFSFNSNRVPNGHIKLGKTGIVFNTNVKEPVFVEVTKGSNDVYFIIVGYYANKQEQVISDNYAAIDLGVNNLATVSFTNGKPFIINGRPLKSINQFYNKTIAKLQSKQDNYINSVKAVDKDKAKTISKRTNRMKSITQKRNNKIDTFMHRASHLIVNQLVSRNISKLIIGYNKYWKQGINLGDKNNQNFVQIPFLKFVEMLQYKCADVGIEVILREESYTSKSSFIDGDEIPTYGTENNDFKPSGNRRYRGLYFSKENIPINGDLNGSLNILRKYLQESEKINIYDIIDPVVVCSTPLVFTIKV